MELPNSKYKLHTNETTNSTAYTGLVNGFTNCSISIAPLLGLNPSNTNDNTNVSTVSNVAFVGKNELILL